MAAVGQPPFLARALLVCVLFLLAADHLEPASAVGVPAAGKDDAKADASNLVPARGSSRSKPPASFVQPAGGATSCESATTPSPSPEDTFDDFGIDFDTEDEDDLAVPALVPGLIRRPGMRVNNAVALQDRFASARQILSELERQQKTDGTLLHKTGDVLEELATSGMQEAEFKTVPSQPYASDPGVTACLQARSWESGKELGRGSYGQVVRSARHEDVAIKIMMLSQSHVSIKDDVTDLFGFAREVAAQTIAADLRVAPQVIQSFVCAHPGEQQEPRFGVIVMQRVLGKPFEKYLKEHPVFDERSVVCCTPVIHSGTVKWGYIPHVLRNSVEEGIKTLNEHGLIVEDLHTNNVMVDDSDNSEPKAVFIDFGLADGQAREDPLSYLTALGCPHGDKAAPEAASYCDKRSVWQLSG